MKLEIPKNEVIKQTNYNCLMETKKLNNDVFIIETPLGIGTIYNLTNIHGNMASVVLDVNSTDDLEYSNSGNFETVIVSIRNDNDIKDDVIVEKMKLVGFSKIIIVKTILLQ